jgi:hypothetical protein
MMLTKAVWEVKLDCGHVTGARGTVPKGADTGRPWYCPTCRADRTITRYAARSM